MRLNFSDISNSEQIMRPSKQKPKPRISNVKLQNLMLKKIKKKITNSVKTTPIKIIELNTGL